MQELIEKAKQLLSSGEVARVLGWRMGENVWDAELYPSSKEYTNTSTSG